MPQIQKIVEEYNAVKQIAFQKVKELFQQELVSLFNDKVQSIGWYQYTPYFNDGEECEFGVETESIYINGESVDDIDALSYKITYYLNGDPNYPFEDDWDIDLYKKVEEIGDFLESIPTEIYLDMFGDHKQITVTKDTITIEDFDHD